MRIASMAIVIAAAFLFSGCQSSQAIFGAGSHNGGLNVSAIAEKRTSDLLPPVDYAYARLRVRLKSNPSENPIVQILQSRTIIDDIAINDVRTLGLYITITVGNTTLPKVPLYLWAYDTSKQKTDPTGWQKVSLQPEFLTPWIRLSNSTRISYAIEYATGGVTSVSFFKDASGFAQQVLPLFNGGTITIADATKGAISAIADKLDAGSGLLLNRGISSTGTDTAQLFLEPIPSGEVGQDISIRNSANDANVASISLNVEYSPSLLSNKLYNGAEGWPADQAYNLSQGPKAIEITLGPAVAGVGSVSIAASEEYNKLVLSAGSAGLDLGGNFRSECAKFKSSMKSKFGLNEIDSTVALRDGVISVVAQAAWKNIRLSGCFTQEDMELLERHQKTLPSAPPELTSKLTTADFPALGQAFIGGSVETMPQSIPAKFTDAIVLYAADDAPVDGAGLTQTLTLSEAMEVIRTFGATAPPGPCCFGTPAILGDGGVVQLDRNAARMILVRTPTKGRPQACLAVDFLKSESGAVSEVRLRKPLPSETKSSTSGVTFCPVQ